MGDPKGLQLGFRTEWGQLWRPSQACVLGPGGRCSRLWWLMRDSGLLSAQGLLPGTTRKPGHGRVPGERVGTWSVAALLRPPAPWPPQAPGPPLGEPALFLHLATGQARVDEELSPCSAPVATPSRAREGRAARPSRSASASALTFGGLCLVSPASPPGFFLSILGVLAQTQRL